jgi:Xaa-Pro dipeptidase
MSQKRMDRLFALLETAQLDAIALNPGPTMQYVSGFHFVKDERPKILILGKDTPTTLILPAFEARALEFPPDVKPFLYGENPVEWLRVFSEACQYAGITEKKVGVEPLQLRFLEWDYLTNASPKTQFRSASPELDFLRMKKDAEEISAMRKAASIAQQAFLATLKQIKVGISEREIASELVLQLFKAGSDTHIPFQPIIASGPNSASAHAVPSDRKLSPGDLVIVDWGARSQGYCSDITRTLAVDDIDPELEKVAKIVADANKAGRAAAVAGAPIGSVDHAARTVITDAGYGEYFTHRTGHGLGLDEHEPPNVIGDNHMSMEEGFTFTVEPGIYFAGRGGVRIEDDVVVAKEGGESLTDLPRELIRIS